MNYKNSIKDVVSKVGTKKTKKSRAYLTDLIKEEIQAGNYNSDTIQNLARMLSDNLSEYDRETIATILSSGN